MMDLGKNEEEIARYWEENKILESVREKNRGRKPFYFLDGPPFVSGDLHPGQMWVKSMKDVMLRYKRSRGFDVYDRAGYDVHGLPIEKRAEANLKITSKKEIETKIGIEAFIRSCSEYVNAYIGRMDNDYKRFGMSLDFANPYIPSRMPYMEVEWSFLKNIYGKGLIYTDKRATTYCTSCQTAVSQGSMEVEYREDTDPSILVLFRIDNARSKAKMQLQDHTYLLVWTTTPWTLPANMAVAANPEEKYAMVRFGDRSIIMAKDRVEFVSRYIKESAIVEAEFYGSELMGIAYLSPLEDLVPEQRSFRKHHTVVMAKELVDVAEGSGLVHIAPGHGLEDYAIGKRNRMPIFSPIDEQGAYTAQAGKYAGLRVPEEANMAVLKDMTDLGVLVNSGTIKHSYPHCWRCDTKLIFMATEQWFINIQKVKKKIISENRKVSWHPSVASRWQEDFLQSSPDWTISRQRYWGTPIPIWICECGNKEVMGSVAELREKAVNRKDVDSLTDLHRPYVDRIALRCGSCGKEMHRISDVLDVWFDSSVAYRASLSEEQFSRLFPMDFVLEAIEQLRGWFSYQLKTSVMVHGKRPFKNVVMHAMMLGADGREMHKKLGNYVPLNEILKTTTADSFRLWCTSHVPEVDLIFSVEKINEANKTVLLLYNISNLFKYYSDAAGYRNHVPKKKANVRGMGYEDKWIYAKMNMLIRDVTTNLDDYEIHKAAERIRSFVTEDFSRFYLRMAKKKLLYADRRTAKAILDLINYLMYNTLLLIAPFTPFAAEKIYLDNYDELKSISLDSWPKSSVKEEDESLVSDFGVALDAITALLYSREKEGIKLRQPLKSAVVEVSESAHMTALQKLSYLIEDYVNVKTLDIRQGSKFSMEVRPLFSGLGPAFKANAGFVADALKGENAERMADAIGTNGYYEMHTDRGIFRVMPEHFTVVKKAVSGDAVDFKYGTAIIDKEISEELRIEATIREFERQVQLIRKEMQLRKSNEVSLRFDATEDIAGIILKNRDTIARNINAEKLERGIAPGSQVKEIEVGGETVRVAVIA